MEASIRTSSELDWASLALIATAIAAIIGLRFHAQSIQDSVRPVFWIEAAVMMPSGMLRVMTRNMGAGPVTGLHARMWLVPLEAASSIQEQQKIAKQEWERLRRAEPDIQFGRPIPALERAEFGRGPVAVESPLALGIYEFTVTDVHGRTHRGTSLKRPFWQRVRRRRQTPGTVLITRFSSPMNPHNATARQPDPPPPESLEQMDLAARRQIEAQAPDGFALVDKIILLLNRGTALLSGTDHDRDLNLLTGLLANRAFNSLWRARQDAAHGYSVQALTLCRAAMEDWGPLVWLEQNPDTTDRWLWAVLDEVAQPTQRPPSFATIWKNLDSPELLASSYDTLSKFAHPKGIGLRWLVHFDEQSTYFHYGPHVSDRDIRTTLFFLVVVAQGFLGAVERLQRRMLGEVETEWREQAATVTQRAHDFVSHLYDEVLQDVEDASEQESGEAASEGAT